MALRLTTPCLGGYLPSWRLEVLASLLSYAIVDARSIAEEVFEDFGYFSQQTEAEIPLKRYSPMSFEEFLALFDLFPWKGIDAAIENGIFGTSVRSDMSLGIYANAKGATIFHKALVSSPILRKVNFTFIDTPNGICFGAQTAQVIGGGSVSPLPGSVTGTMGLASGYPLGFAGPLE
jgi:hypothetical protein